MIDQLIALGASFAKIQPTNFKRKEEKTDLERPYTVMFDKYRVREHFVSPYLS